MTATIDQLLDEYDRALRHTDELWSDLTREQVVWRASEDASGIGWHLAHQAAVAHYLVRNLTAAEPPVDADLERLADSATPEPGRGDLPDLDRLRWFRDTVAERVRVRIGDIARGEVGAPAQLDVVGRTVMVALINHEYQHSKWIGEVRVDVHGLALPEPPTSDLLAVIDGYLVVTG